MKKSLMYLDPLPHNCKYTPQMAMSGYNQLIFHVQRSNKFNVKVLEWCPENGVKSKNGKNSNLTRYFALPRGIPFLTSPSYLCPWSELKGVFTNAKMIHHINADDSLFLHGLLGHHIGKKIIATVHQPLNTFLNRMPKFWTKIFNGVDTLITLSSREYRFFSANLKRTTVVQIPHGNNNSCFSPSKLNTSFGICVGGWLRDYSTLINTFNRLEESHPNFKLYLIARRKPPHFQDPHFKNLSFLFNVPDKILLHLYRNASMLILPIEDCTANNAVLEGLASGIPIITNKVGGIPDYVDDTCSLFFKKKNALDLKTKIEYLLDNPSEIKKMSRAALEKSLNFDWKIISSKIIDTIYLKS